MKRGITLFEVIAIVFLLAVLAALILPALEGTRRPHKVTQCANNLLQLWKMQNVYMSLDNPHHQMPTATGSAFWKALATTQPPLIDLMINDIFLCPLKGDSSPNECDYAGPTKRVNLLDDVDAVGADFRDNHKEYTEGVGSGNVLRKAGDVIEVTGPDWLKLTTDPLFPKP